MRTRSRQWGVLTWPWTSSPVSIDSPRIRVCWGSGISTPGTRTGSGKTIGLNKICLGYPSRTLWALLLVFFCGLTIYQVCERITYYFIRNPLVTVRTYDAPTSIEFPNIVLCPKMQLKASKVAAINPDLLRVMSQLYNDDQSVNLNSTIVKQLKDFDKLNLLKIFKNAGQSTEDLFMRSVLFHDIVWNTLRIG